MTLALASVGCFLLGFSLGFRTRDRVLTKRTDDLRYLFAMFKGDTIEAEPVKIEERA